MGICESPKKGIYVQEAKVSSRPYEEVDPYFSKVSRSICKIRANTTLGTLNGTGFLLKLLKSQGEYLEYFYCLMSNEHIIREEMVRKKDSIYIYYDNEFNNAAINLDVNERYIRSFTHVNLDITVVEILPKDNINELYFLLPETDDIYNTLKNRQIYIPQYAQGKNLRYSTGVIKEIIKYEFSHLASTELGSSGSPIFLKDSTKVIGIHEGSRMDKAENYAIFIYPAINIIKQDISKMKNKDMINDKNKNGKYIYDNGNYYIGQLKNGLPHGKGIKYYKNGIIQYEGDFINGKCEGNGKIFLENGNYYIGQFKNNLPHGKGEEFYKNGNIQYEGDFIGGKREGNGKYIWENGEYYLGQFKNGLSHGKGKEYYENGNIKYEGDFINDKYEGNGKRIFEDGKYYIGQVKNGFPYGEGILYDKNGNIIYEGEFTDLKEI